jgi:hypothetical protein
MKKQKKKEKPVSEKKFPPKKDDFDDLSEKASAGDIKSMMLFLTKHGNRGYEMNELELAELLKKLGRLAAPPQAGAAKPNIS